MGSGTCSEGQPGGGAWRRANPSGSFFSTGAFLCEARRGHAAFLDRQEGRIAIEGGHTHAHTPGQDADEDEDAVPRLAFP